MYKRGLRDEIVREHYHTAAYSANINAVCLPLPSGWASRMGDLGRGWGIGPTEKN
jgi:hypothetical protein